MYLICLLAKNIFCNSHILIILSLSEPIPVKGIALLAVEQATHDIGAFTPPDTLGPSRNGLLIAVDWHPEKAVDWHPCLLSGTILTWSLGSTPNWEPWLKLNSCRLESLRRMEAPDATITSLNS